VIIQQKSKTPGFIKCDKCGSKFPFILMDARDMAEILEQAKRNGWKVQEEKDQTKHHCPNCKDTK